MTTTEKKTGRATLNAWLRLQAKKSKAPRDHGMAAGWKFSIVEFARGVGVSRQTLRQWTVGAVKPDLEHRSALSIATCGDVPIGSWD